MFRYKDATHQEVGPVSREEIQRLVTAGTITANTQVRAEDSVFWEPACRCAGLADLFTGSRTPSPEAAVGQPPAPADIPPPPHAGAIDVHSTTEPIADSAPAADTAKAQGEPAPDPVSEPSAGEPPKVEPSPKADGTRRFFMIGADGREYGPVTSAQLRSWIAQRRANGDTKIRPEDSKDWAPLKTWPEFADALRQQSEPRTETPPSLDSAQATQLADELIANGYGITIGDCLRRSWQLYQRHFGILTGATALVIVLLTLPHLIAGAGNLLSVAFSGVLVAGLSVVFLKTIRGRNVDVNDLFGGFTRGFVPLLVAGILVNVLVGVGLFLCVLPGIYLFVAWTFAYPLIIDRGFDFWPAMELSRRIIHERWWEMLVLWLIAGALLFVGLLVGGVGVFFTAPIAFGMVMFAYEDIFGARKTS